MCFKKYYTKKKFIAFLIFQQTTKRIFTIFHFHILFENKLPKVFSI